MQAAIHGTLYRCARMSERLALGRSSTLRTSGGAPIDVIVEDLSVTGCRIRTSLQMQNGEELVIGLPGVGTRAGRVVWSDGTEIGCEFEAPLTAAEVHETRTTETVIQGQFATFRRSVVTAPSQSEENRFSVRYRLASIVSAAIIAWLLIAAAAVWGYTLFDKMN